MTLEQFVHEFPLPQFAKVTQGYDDPWNPDNEFSTNDFIKVNQSTFSTFELAIIMCQHRYQTRTVRSLMSGDAFSLYNELNGKRKE